MQECVTGRLKGAVIFLCFMAFGCEARADQVWDGGGTDDHYGNPLNWQGNSLPAYEERIWIQDDGGAIVVRPGDTFVPRKILAAYEAGTTTIAFTGGGLTNSSYWMVGTTEGARGIINVTGDVSYGGLLTRDLSLGYAGGAGELNISGGWVEVYGEGSDMGLAVPGDVGFGSQGAINISGGVLKVHQLVLSSGGVINLSNDGLLLLAGPQQDSAESHISAGRITAEGGAVRPLVQEVGDLTYVRSPGISNVIVSHSLGYHHGWPAAEGAWSWADGNEIVVMYKRSLWSATPTDLHYSVPGTDVRYQARSIDGGFTWTTEEFVESGVKGHAALDFSSPEFAFKMRGDGYWYTLNRGVTWEGPTFFPQWGLQGHANRTDYIVQGSDSMTLFMTALKDDGKQGRTHCVQTDDGALSFNPINWMRTKSPPVKHTYVSAEDENQVERHNGNPAHYYDVMPSTVEIGPSKFVSAVRHRRGADNWIGVYRSMDAGYTWDHLSNAVHGAENPPSLLRLEDGRLLLTYGYRLPNRFDRFSIRAKLSSDGGETWGPETVLRSDGLNSDLGYPRTIQRADGAVIALYYIATPTHLEHHIAASIWYP